MAHEITSWDSLLLNSGKAAWHGLGTIIDEDVDAIEGAERVGLLWDVDQIVPEVTLPSGRKMLVEDLRMNVRRDSEEVLGVVSKDWQIIQNRQLAEFVNELTSGSDRIKVESCGSIRGGTKVWFLVKGESFSVRRDDVVEEYICISNGFDGKTALRATPTSVRVVCSNTLHMVIPSFDAESGRVQPKRNGYACSHVGDITTRIDDVREALGLYQQASSASRDSIANLDAANVSKAQMTQFFLDMYSMHFHNVNSPEASQDDKTKALHQFAKYARRFDREANKFGATKWIMANAYTGWLQHDRNAMSRFVKDDRAINRQLFGTDIDRSDDAMAYAIAMD
jgi:hypothetical protein